MAISGTGVEIFLYKYHDNTVSGALGQKLDLIGVVEDFISIIFTRSWTGIGDWEIVMPSESDKITLFKQAQFIKIHNKACGFINQEETVIDDESNTVTFRGSELKGLVSLRVIDPTSFTGDVTMSVGELKARFINENISQANSDRLIPSDVLLGYDFQAGSDVTYHPVYADMGDVITNLSAATDTGWYADIQYKTAQVQPASKNRLIWERDGYPDLTNVRTGAYINSSGVVTDSPGDAYTDYIKVGNNNSATPMVFYGIHKGTRNGNKRVHLYQKTGDETYQWLTQIGVQQNVTPDSAYSINFAVPAGLNYYIRCSFVEADEDVMLEATPRTSYEAYHPAVYETFDRIEFHPSLLGLDCTKDRTQSQLEAGDEPLILSYNLDTLYNSTLENTRFLPNVAYVAGQGSGAERTVVVVNENNKTKLDRFENLIDARDISDPSALPQRGIEYLSQFGTNIAYTCEASKALLGRYTYTPWFWEDPDGGRRSSYDDSVEIGNYGTFVDEKTNFSCDFQITSITEVYEEDTFRLELQFGYNANNLNDNLSILSSRTQGLINADPSSGGGGGGAYLKYWLGIKDGENVRLKLLPSNAAETTYAGEQAVIGNYGGYISLLAQNAKDVDTTSRTLRLYDSSSQSNVRDALKLVNRVNGTDTEYTVLHSGNIGSYRWNTLYCTTLNATGNIFTSNSNGANIYTTKGDIYTNSGNLYTDEGDIYTEDGGIYAMLGDISAGGNLSVGGDADISGDVTATNVTLSNKLSCKTAHIEDSYYPMFELKPTANSVTKVQRVEGSLYGEIGLQAWADSTGNDRTILSVYDPVEHSAVDGRIAMRQCVGGTWTTYNMLHTGNIASYATPLSSSSVSPITWDTTYVNTDSGKTSYVCYRLGKIRIYRFKIVLKSALTGTTVIGTIASGHRPNTTIYGTINTLSDTTTDVRTIAFATGGNISMYKNAKATTYYGTVVFFTS